MNYYIMQNCSHCTQTGNGIRLIVSYCASAVPYTDPIPVSMQCERAINGISWIHPRRTFFRKNVNFFLHLNLSKTMLLNNCFPYRIRFISCVTLNYGKESACNAVKCDLYRECLSFSFHCAAMKHRIHLTIVLCVSRYFHAGLPRSDQDKIPCIFPVHVLLAFSLCFFLSTKI